MTEKGKVIFVQAGLWAIALATVAVLSWFVLDKRDCEAGGGIYVRGLWGVECIQAARRP